MQIFIYKRKTLKIFNRKIMQQPATAGTRTNTKHTALSVSGTNKNLSAQCTKVRPTLKQKEIIGIKTLVDCSNDANSYANMSY